MPLRRVVEEVPDHEEVAGEAGLADDAEFVLHALHFGGLVVGEVRSLDIEAVALFHAFGADGVEVLFAAAGKVFRHGEFWVVVDLVFADGRQVDVAAFRDGDGIGQGVGLVREEAGHFFRAFEVVFRPSREAEAAGVVDGGLGADAEKEVVGFSVLFFQVVGVIRGDEADVAAPGKLDQFLVDLFIFGQAMVLQFDEEVVWPEDFEVVVQGLFCSRVCADQEFGGDFSAEAGAEADDAFGAFFEDFLVDARFVVESS